jgi:hypothetical protein
MSKYNSLAATIRLISHNANRSSTAINALLNGAGATTDIILIQEANITDSKYEVTHPNVILLKPLRGNRRSNCTAAYISHSNPYLKVTQSTDLCKDPDLQILEISTDLIPSFFLINIYNEHDSALKLYTVPRSLTPLSLPHRCIITGDLHANHALWNRQVHTPRRAQELATLIEEQNWRLVNVPDTPTYYYRNGKGSSVLDQMLATPHMAKEITNCAIDNEQATGSDHEVIRFQVISLHPDVEVTPHELRLNWRKTDWDTFTTIIKNSSATTRTQWEQ